MAIKTSTLSKLLSNYVKNQTAEPTEVETAVAAALKKAGYDKVIVFMHNDMFVMINTIASMKAI
jgi:2',3'-cyclic-nucleotide 2'-phosphodiesterase (5'-nucleotidase family)